jgi:septum formation protein
MLEAAGVDHAVEPASIDEEPIKAAIPDDAAAAVALAEAKAIAVSHRRPEAWVIGSDSIVSVEGRRFSKPPSRDEAEEHLRAFSGKTMVLTSAVVLARGGLADWSVADQARLEVRALSDAFIGAYLDREWPAVAGCVGVFRMEGAGVHLFDSVAGSHFSILGMPLLPLLGALRDRGVLTS